MSETYTAEKVTDHVFWVGAVDWGVRDFHGYLTSQGTSYNAFLILADRITLIDTVKAPFKAEMLSRIASLVPPDKVDYIVSNHAEMDHSGSLLATIAVVKPEKVYASAMGVKALGEHFGLGSQISPVKDGETISLGNLGLTFLETRMIHWPDSMFSYLPEERLLFSQDGFGMHLATAERFDDQIPEELLERESAKYYANILLPLSGLIAKLLNRVEALGLPLDIIAPDHGPIWRKNPARIVELYGKWASQPRTRKTIVAYDTMWQSTALMARVLGEGLRAGGATPRILPLRANHRSDIATELLDAGALIVGSPTINNTMFPTVADLLAYVRGLKPKGLLGGAFGSYGWSGEAVGQVAAELESMKVDVHGEDLRVKYVPQAEDLERCHGFGKAVGERLCKAVGQSGQAESC